MCFLKVKFLNALNRSASKNVHRAYKTLAQTFSVQTFILPSTIHRMIMQNTNKWALHCNETRKLEEIYDKKLTQPCAVIFQIAQICLSWSINQIYVDKPAHLFEHVCKEDRFRLSWASNWRHLFGNWLHLIWRSAGNREWKSLYPFTKSHDIKQHLYYFILHLIAVIVLGDT